MHRPGLTAWSLVCRHNFFDAERPSSSPSDGDEEVWQGSGHYVQLHQTLNRKAYKVFIRNRCTFRRRW